MTPDDRERFDAFIASTEHYGALIRRHRPSIALPADPDVMNWTAADVDLFASAVATWGEWSA